MPGEIMVSGNADNGGVNSGLFSSNWDLSSKREATHELIKVPGFVPASLVVASYTDTRLLVPNTNTLNRRVEIAIN